MVWVHHRIEQLPASLIAARLQNVDLIIELEDTALQMREAKESVEFLKAEANALKPTKRRKQNVFRNDD